jgi:hypothetical protein
LSESSGSVGASLAGEELDRGDGAIEHVFPSVEFIVKFVFVLDITEGVEQEVAYVSEDGGVAGRDTVLHEGGEEFAEDEVDVRGGQEVAAERSSELGAEAMGFEDLLFLVSMEKAEGRVILLTQHAALAAIGEKELAEMRIVGRRSFSGHGNLGRKDVTK